MGVLNVKNSSKAWDGRKVSLFQGNQHHTTKWAGGREKLILGSGVRGVLIKANISSLLSRTPIRGRPSPGDFSFSPRTSSLSYALGPGSCGMCVQKLIMKGRRSVVSTSISDDKWAIAHLHHPWFGIQYISAGELYSDSDLFIAPDFVWKRVRLSK